MTPQDPGGPLDLPWPAGSGPEGLREAFADYERALLSDDLEALDRLFAPGPTTLRGDASGLLVGHDAISRSRASRSSDSRARS
jgi:amidase